LIINDLPLKKTIKQNIFIKKNDVSLISNPTSLKYQIDLNTPLQTER